MIGFKTFSRNYGKKFISFHVEEKSSDKLRKWCQSNGFDITKTHGKNDVDPQDFLFHVTLFYSDNSVYLTNNEIEIEPIELTIKQMEVLGPEKNIPVFLLNKTPVLSNIRKIYEGTGLKDSWPEWKPHLTVSYNWDGTPDLRSVSLPNFKIMVDKIVIKNQKG